MANLSLLDSLKKLLGTAVDTGGSSTKTTTTTTTPKTSNTAVNNTAPSAADIARGQAMNKKGQQARQSQQTKQSTSSTSAKPPTYNNVTIKAAQTLDAGGNQSNKTFTPTVQAPDPRTAARVNTPTPTTTQAQNNSTNYTVPTPSVSVPTLSDDAIKSLWDTIGFNYDFLSPEAAQSQALQLLGELDLSGYAQLREALMRSSATNKAEIIRQFDNLFARLQEQREDNKKQFGKARATVSENAYDRSRELLNYLASRGLAGSGLQQLGEVQNRMETGNQISALANQFYDTEEEIARQQTEATGQKAHQLRSLEDSIAMQLANITNSENQYKSQYQAQLASLANQILQNDMAKGNMLMNEYYNKAGWIQNETQFQQSLAEQMRQFDAQQALAQANYNLNLRQYEDSLKNLTNNLQGQIEAIMAQVDVPLYERAAALMQAAPEQFTDLATAVRFAQQREDEIDRYKTSQAQKYANTSYTGNAQNDLATLQALKSQGIITTAEDVQKYAPDFYKKYSTTKEFKSMFDVKPNPSSLMSALKNISVLSTSKR